MSANFRKAYYSSLGVQVVEVKPSLETALQGDVLGALPTSCSADCIPSDQFSLPLRHKDVEHLNKLCLWVRIPHAYRPLVWKVLLGTLPLQKEVWPFVEEQRAEEYRDLKRCVKFLDGTQRYATRRSSRITDLWILIGPSKSEGDSLTAQKMVHMLLVRVDKRAPHYLAEAHSPAHLAKLYHLQTLANTMLEICDSNEIDAYWLFESFVHRYRVPVIGEESGEEVGDARY